MNMHKYDDCEIDCNYHCWFCDESFHDIKTENELPHDLELPESGSTLAGNYYCHTDCGR